MLRPLRNFEVPDKPNPAHHLEDCIHYVDFPPCDALSRGPRKVFVIIVPLAESNKRYERVIPAAVAGFGASTATVDVVQRLYPVRGVPNANEANAGTKKD